MQFRRVGMIWRSSKPESLAVAGELISLLGEYNISVVTSDALSDALGRPRAASERDLGHCDLIMVLGGDGAILSALDWALPGDIPVVGINFGRLGFLTEIDPLSLKQDIAALLDGKYTLDSRTTMTIRGFDQRDFFALNEIVVTRSTPALRVLSLEIEVNGTLVDRISGDGLIVASSTGSTAYSLSAGGPIVMPSLDCFVITPICAHTMTARPVVVSASDRVSVRVLDDRGGAQAVLDGRKNVPLVGSNSQITILRSDMQARFVRLHDRNYFSLLRGKLSEWTH